jgi:hypothetical protein
MPYKDRSAGLIVFGILTILLGCLAALFVLSMVFQQAASAKVTGAPAPFSALPAMFIYGVLAWRWCGWELAPSWPDAGPGRCCSSFPGAGSSWDSFS